jgi:two-component system OmpR family response regulator
VRLIEIWASEDRVARNVRFSGLVHALGQAGLKVRLCHCTPDAADPPDHALIWQMRDDPHARIQALAAGAFDIIGPWMDEGEALVRALRHARAGQSGTGASGAQMRLGELEIDLIEREAWRQGRTLGLLQREFELLNFLARRPDHPHSRQALLRAIWRLGFDPGTNVVEVHISRLRAKLDRGFDWPMLRTVKGAGYALVSGNP